MSEQKNESRDVIGDEAAEMEIIKDISQWDDEKSSLFTEYKENVLLLTMSTLNSDHIDQANYEYTTENGKEVIQGYGQLEPIPKMLIKEGKTPLLILVLASAGSQKPKEFTFGSDREKRKLAAVDFFLEQIEQDSKVAGAEVGFLGIDSEEAIKGASTAVSIIRDIREKNKEEGKAFNLYMDIHGGFRDDQIVLDAIINMLHIDDIQLREAYSIKFRRGENSPIVSVKDKLKVFDFASGMNEFINHGYAGNLQKYVNEDSGIVTYMGKISEAIALSRVDKFEEALDAMPDKIKELKKNNILLQMFVRNIEEDYGVLLRNERTIFDEISWARKKGFYQQCLAMIEEKVGEYVISEWLTLTSYLYKELKDSQSECNWYKEIKKDQVWKDSENKTGGIPREHLERMSYYLRQNDKTMAKYLEPEFKEKDREVTFYSANKRNEGAYKSTYRIKLSEFKIESFYEFLDQWAGLKKLRNDIFHINPMKSREISDLKEEVEKKIDDFLGIYQAVEPTYRAIVGEGTKSGNFWLKLEGKDNGKHTVTRGEAKGDGILLHPSKIKEGDKVEVVLVEDKPNDASTYRLVRKISE